MSRCLLYAISRWGIEQPRSSFGSISFPFPMKVAVADGGARGARPPQLFLDQTEARRAKKIFLGAPPTLSKGLDDHPPPYLKVWIRALSSLR